MVGISQLGRGRGNISRGIDGDDDAADVEAVEAVDAVEISA